MHTPWMKAMPAPEVRTEVRFGDPSPIAFSPLAPGVLVPLHLALGLSLLVPVFLAFLLLSHVLTPFGLLHLAFVPLAIRMQISTLRLLLRPALVLRSHFAAIPALRLLIPPLFIWAFVIWPLVGPRLFLRPRLLLRPRLFLPIFRARIVLLIIAMLALCCGDHRHPEKQRSTNPAHDWKSLHVILTREP
jgi:hypothetical protein